MRLSGNSRRLKLWPSPHPGFGKAWRGPTPDGDGSTWEKGLGQAAELPQERGPRAPPQINSGRNPSPPLRGSDGSLVLSSTSRPWSTTGVTKFGLPSPLDALGVPTVYFVRLDATRHFVGDDAAERPLPPKMQGIDGLVFNAASFVAGLFLLEYGADKFIDHTAVVAKRLNVSPTLIGLLTCGAEWEEVRTSRASCGGGRADGQTPLLTATGSSSSFWWPWGRNNRPWPLGI